MDTYFNELVITFTRLFDKLQYSPHDLANVRNFVVEKFAIIKKYLIPIMAETLKQIDHNHRKMITLLRFIRDYVIALVKYNGSSCIYMPTTINCELSQFLSCIYIIIFSIKQKYFLNIPEYHYNTAEFIKYDDAIFSFIDKVGAVPAPTTPQP
jgi:hypothetical protein